MATVENRFRRTRPLLAAFGLFAIVLTWFSHSEPSPLRLSVVLLVFYLSFWGIAWLRRSPGQQSASISVRFLLCSVSIALGIAVFEFPASMGLMDYRGIFANPSPPWERAGYRPEPGLLAVKDGPCVLQEAFRGNDLHWLKGAGPAKVYQASRHYDNLGFRNLAESPVLHPDVVLMGDSFIEGAHVADDEVISARLEQELGSGSRVVNFGQSGYGPEQERQALCRFALPLSPRICVWAFYEGNDLDDLAEYDRQLARFQQAPTRPLLARYVDRSFIRNALVFTIRTAIAPPPRKPADRYSGRFRRADGQSVPIYFASGDYRFQDEGRSRLAGSAELTRLRNVLTDASERCQAVGTTLIVTFIPTKWRVYRDKCQFDPGAACRQWPVDELPTVVEELVSCLALPQNIRYVDLTPHFQAEARKGRLVYLADDTHWSADGHAVAARVLGEAVRQAAKSSDF
jgi:hypothetical protein